MKSDLRNVSTMVDGVTQRGTTGACASEHGCVDSKSYWIANCVSPILSMPNRVGADAEVSHF